jgi:hypothetical protein
MKNKLTNIATIALLVSVSFIACNSPAQKVEEAQEDVKEAKQDLAIAQEEYQNDIDSYRVQTAARIAENEKSILEFKARIANEKKEAREDYNQKLEALENKNNDMKKSMDVYKAEGKEKWEAFKTEFSHDMDELGKAFKDLTVKNVDAKKTNK